jgi:hypothetical protein
VGYGPRADEVVTVDDVSRNRPFGPNAPWNIPVSLLPLHPNPEEYVDRLWLKAPSTRPGNINLSFDDYTYAVYDVSDATGMYEVQVEWDSNLSGVRVPWNPSWQPAPGDDGQVILLDPERGIEWNFFQVRLKNSTIAATNANRVPGDYRTREIGFRPSRGIGIPYLAMLVRPHEIAAGQIAHALSMVVRNTDGAHAVPPATKLEKPNRQFDGLPEGMRFALNVTDREIDEWVASLPKEFDAQARRSARIIAVALRDYGWFITDTGGGAHLQFESRVSAGAEWDRLGLGHKQIGEREYPRDLLDGLLKPHRISVIVPSDQYPKPLLARRDR